MHVIFYGSPLKQGYDTINLGKNERNFLEKYSTTRSYLYTTRTHFNFINERQVARRRPSEAPLATRRLQPPIFFSHNRLTLLPLNQIGSRSLNIRELSIE